MVTPILWERALAPLRARDRAGMIHRATRGVKTETPGPGATKVITWAYSGVAVKARLNPVAQESKVRAEAPANVQVYLLTLEAGTDVQAGDRWMVTGTLSKQEWAREVLVQRPAFPKSVEVNRTAIVIDVKANP